jgi:tetratricopeptide (TPR) repeat protein
MLLLVSVAGCGSSDPSIPAPVEVDASHWEPEVADLFARLLADARGRPESGEARGRLGMAYEANDLLDAAQESYDHAIALAPDDARWRYLAAVTAAGRGDLDLALLHVDETIARDDTYAPAHWRRGQWLFAQGDLGEAANAYRRATELKPNHPAGWLGLARVHLQRNENEEAAVLLQDAIERRPRGAFVAYLRQLLGVAYRNLGRLDEARTELAAGLAGPPDWSDDWHDEIAQYRVSLIERVRRAQQLVEAHQSEQAIASLEEVLPQNPDDALVLETLGVAYLDVGRVGDAKRTLEHLVRLHPDRALSHVNLSVALQAIGATSEALAESNAALEISPKLGSAHRQRAALFEAMRRDEDALASYETAIALDPSDRIALVSAAEVAARLGHTERALELARRARDSSPDDPRALRILERYEGEVGP